MRQHPYPCCRLMGVGVGVGGQTINKQANKYLVTCLGRKCLGKEGAMGRNSHNLL